MEAIKAMKIKTILVLLLLLLITPLSTPAKKKDKTKDSVSTAAGRVSYPWSKVFKDTKKPLVKAIHSDLSLYLYDSKVYMEVPVRNFGREYLLSSTVTRSSEPVLTGIQANAQQIFILNRVDSSVVFSRPRPYYRVGSSDSTVARGLELANRMAVFRKAKIEAWSSDSSKVLFETSSFLSADNNDIFDIKGNSFGDGISIASCNLKTSLGFFESVSAFRHCVCLAQSVTGKLSLSAGIGIISNSPDLQASVQTLIALLPDASHAMPPRKADGSVGTGYVKYTDYRDVNNVHDGYYATRRRFAAGDSIVFYVDTLMPETWFAAVQRAADGWNGAFERNGLGRPVVLKPYPKDSAFSAADPMADIISFANNSSSAVTLSMPVDYRTGEILGSHISVPRALADNVRRYGVCKMAEVDSRYRRYDLPDDLLCEILQANMLKAFGRVLGLSNNLAGSAAYSPEQLRDPSFTRKYGISASVMDNQIYNYVAMPGDREKGVVLTPRKPGVCDEFVIKYLYAPAKDDSTLKAWVAEHHGDPRYFYGKPSIRHALDPRCQSFDLGNDPFTAAANMLHHYKYFVKNAPSWYNYDKLPQNYRLLFPEFVIVDLNSLIHTLTPYVGGVCQNEYQPGSSVPVTKAVPEALQRKAVREIFRLFRDLSWLDANPEFYQNSSPAGEVGKWANRQNLLLIPLLTNRIKYMDESIHHSSDPYTQADLLRDISANVFAPVIAGRKPSGDDIRNINAYVAFLANVSPAVSALSKDKPEAAALNGGVEPTREIDYYQQTNLGPVILKEMEKVRGLLLKAKSLAQGMDKDRLQFSIRTVDKVLSVDR